MTFGRWGGPVVSHFAGWRPERPFTVYVMLVGQASLPFDGAATPRAEFPLMERRCRPWRGY